MIQNPSEPSPEEKLFRSRRKRGIGLALVLLFLASIYLGLRFLTYSDSWMDGKMTLPDTDPYYRLHRIETMVQEEKWSYPLLDTNLSFPNGFEVPWALGLDWVLTLPARILEIGDPNRIAYSSAFMIPFLSMLTLLILVLLCLRNQLSILILPAGFILSFSSFHRWTTEFGNLDHHFLESFFLLLAFFMTTSTKAARGMLFISPKVILLAFAPLFWPQAWILGPCFFLADLIDPDEERRKGTANEYLVAGVLHILCLLPSYRFWSGTINPFGFSWWTPLLYALLSTSFSVIEQIRRRTSMARLLISIALVIGMFAFLWVRNTKFSDGRVFEASAEALKATSGTISLTTEAGSPFSWYSLGRNVLTVLLFVFGILGTLLFCRNSKNWRPLMVVVIPLLLSFLQIRLFLMVVPVLIFGFAYTFLSFAERIQSPTVLRRFFPMAAALFLFILEIPSYAKVQGGNLHPLFKGVREANQIIMNQPSSDTLQGVAAHWEFGHWILQESKQPVVAHPFQDHTSYSFLSFLLSSEITDLNKFLKKHPVRFLYIEAPTGRIERWLSILHKSSDPFFDTGRTPTGKIILKPRKALFDLWISRLYFGFGVLPDGQFPGQLRIIASTTFRSPDNPNFPGFRIFERVPGAKVLYEGKSKNMSIEADIYVDGYPFRFRQSLSENSEGQWEWTLPYAKVESNAVKFSGRYEILNGKREVVGEIMLDDPLSVIRGSKILFRH